MLAISPRKAVYASLAIIGLLALALGGMGLARAASNSQSADTPVVCVGLEDALALVEAAANLDNIGDRARDELRDLADEIEHAIELEEEGELDRSLELKQQIASRLKRLSNLDNAELSELMTDALVALEPCIPPVPMPQPGSHVVYSAKFVCGRSVGRESMVTPNFGSQPFLYNEQNYQTEINVHNYHLNRVPVWGQVMVANSHDEARGPVSPMMRRVIAPNEAFKINCQDIREALTPVDPPDVCPGLKAAHEVLSGIVSRPTTDVASADFIPEIREIASMIEKAIALEEEGAYDEALELERRIVEALNELARKAEQAGNTRIARALIEARDLVRRCILSTTGETDAVSDRPVRLPALVEGFVVIRTQSQLEVTGAYRANSHNKTVTGGIGSGTSIDVEQIRPHRARGPLPIPTDIER